MLMYLCGNITVLQQWCHLIVIFLVTPYLKTIQMKTRKYLNTEVKFSTRLSLTFFSNFAIWIYLNKNQPSYFVFIDKLKS